MQARSTVITEPNHRLGKAVRLARFARMPSLLSLDR